MKIETLKYILQTAESDSITQAAESLFMSQQQLSRMILEAEKEFGVSLFERSKKGIQVRDDSKEILEKIALIVHTYDDIIEHAYSYQPSGSFNIATDACLWYDNVHSLKLFANNYPKLHLKITSFSREALLDVIANMQYDVGIMIRFLVNGQYYTKISENLTFTPIYRYPVALYVNRRSIYAKKYKTISLDEAATLPLINFKPSFNTISTTEDLLSMTKTKSNIAYEINNIQFLFDLIKNNLDLVYIGCNLPQARHDELVFIPIKEEIFFVYGTVTAQDTDKPELIKKLYDFLLKLELQNSRHY